MSEQQQPKKPRVLRPFPSESLEEAVKVMDAIGEKNNGRPMDRLLLADALRIKQGSSDFRDLLSASFKYGLTTGTEKSDKITPTTIGQQYAKPLNTHERLSALREAALAPELLRRIYEHYDRSKLPTGTFFKNALERTFGVPPQFTEELAALVHANARFAGLVRDISGDEYIFLTGADVAVEEDQSSFEEVPGEQDQTDTTAPEERSREESPVQPEMPAKPKQIFLAHGKNRAPVEALKKILDKFKIPYVMAMDEPNAGRPISQKVASLMESCSAAILVFTKDEEFRTPDGEVVWRPSENLVYELGAAAVLYGSKIIIFKENGIRFAADFQDLGYITFDQEAISSKALELLSELIALDFIRVQPV